MAEGDRALDDYLGELRSRLRALPHDEVSEILDELRAHVRDSAALETGPAERGITQTLARLGSPAELAALYVTDRLLADAGKGGSPWLLLRAVWRWAATSVIGGLALLGLVAGYLVAASFFLAALVKPFAPERVGLWRLNGEDFSLRLGLVAARQSQGVEILGWWIVPLGLLLGAGAGWLTPRAARWAIRRLRPTSLTQARSTTTMAALEEPTPHGTGWRQSRWLAFGEFALVIALLVADFYHLVFFSKVPFLFLLGWISLRVRGLGWRDVGFVRPRQWLPTLALGTLAGIALELFSTYVTVPFWWWLTGQPPDLSKFRPLVANPGLLAIVLAANWPLAGFGEEMVFRGYLMNRVAGVGGGSRSAWALGLLLVSAVFGLGHVGQGLTGWLQEGLAGLLLGLLYLGAGRKLAVPIIAHGISNTVALTLIFFDRYPGV